MIKYPENMLAIRQANNERNHDDDDDKKSPSQRGGGAARSKLVTIRAVDQLAQTRKLICFIHEDVSSSVYVSRRKKKKSVEYESSSRRTNRSTAGNHKYHVVLLNVLDLPS